MSTNRPPEAPDEKKNAQPLKRMEVDERENLHASTKKEKRAYEQTDNEKAFLDKSNIINENIKLKDISIREHSDGTFHVELEFSSTLSQYHLSEAIKFSNELASGKDSASQNIPYKTIDPYLILINENNASKVLGVLGINEATVQDIFNEGKVKIKAPKQVQQEESTLEKEQITQPESTAEPVPKQNKTYSTERGSRLISSENIEQTTEAIKRVLGDKWALGETNTVRGKNIELLKITNGDDPKKSFEILPTNKFKTNSIDNDTFVAMLQAFKAANVAGTLPEIKTATEELQAVWKKAIEQVYPGKTIEVKLKGETLKAKAEPVEPSVKTEPEPARPGLGSRTT